jgi:hypothetical protein
MNRQKSEARIEIRGSKRCVRTTNDVEMHSSGIISRISTSRSETSELRIRDLILRIFQLKHIRIRFLQLSSDFKKLEMTSTLPRTPKSNPARNIGLQKDETTAVDLNALTSQDEAPRQQSQRRRRRPRKLNRATSDTDQATSQPVGHKVEGEIVALKRRVGEVEAQVYAIRSTSSAPERKGVRRRGRGRRESGNEDAERVTETEAGAQPKIEKKITTETGKLVDDVEEDEIEEIVRERPEPRSERERRGVTVVGSYRIPLPVGVSERDVQAVQRGLSSVSNIARRVMAEAKSSEGSGTVTGISFKYSQNLAELTFV